VIEGFADGKDTGEGCRSTQRGRVEARLRVEQPEGAIEITRPVLWSLVALRIYLIALIVLTGYRFAQYEHWVK